MDELQELQRWYLAQCNGDWEHDRGIQIRTLDNPGWRVQINLASTVLEGVTFSEIADLAPEQDWIRCWVENDAFQGAGGPLMLAPILRHFLAWANGQPPLRA
jgi:hypothetical protein